MHYLPFLTKCTHMMYTCIKKYALYKNRNTIEKGEEKKYVIKVLQNDICLTKSNLSWMQTNLKFICSKIDKK